ncbi:hypothetical protein OPV22_023965 [Ensete ventricosum]|uniref:DUF1995 domain-containing protein n=1 Tax=Ensete ventricosum TaxID=4639 RepID=A0AAV8QY51_ENSVE|nr:hypothetical protein OPV22_023965 [Ensete ventricosum]
MAATAAASISCHNFYSSYAHASSGPHPVSRRSPAAALTRGGRLFARAKFENFDAPSDVPLLSSYGPNSGTGAVPEQQELDQDSDLPSDLEGAIRQSSQASASFISSGGMRAIVELLIPQIQFLDAEGAQAELWELSRIFLESLIEESGGQRVKAIFPDAGAAALLKYQWADANFGFSSLSDRKPVDNEDEVVIMVVPDYQMLEYVERVATLLSEDPPRPLIMWNPRLVSEDVGVGINIRNLRRYFLRQVFIKLSLIAELQITFTVVYSMRPLPTGAIFRCYPGMWKVFYDDANRPGRYLLAKEQPGRPDATDIELTFGNVDEKSEKAPSFLDKAVSMFTSINRFMKAISR